MAKSITEPRAYYKPFSHPKAFEFYETHESMHWLPKEVPMHQDVQDWNHKLSKQEKLFLTQIFRFFTQADVDVASAYATKYIPFFPVPEIRMMLLSFASREATHITAYSHLIDTLGMPETTYKQFLEYTEMKEKHDYFEKFVGTDNSQIAQQMVVFSAFTEGMQLFSSFIMLLNFSRFNKMNGMGQIITWSVRDESCLVEGSEVLTTTGWKNIESISYVDKVAQYDLVSEAITFIEPTKIIKTQSDKSILFAGPNYHQHVTPEHRMVTNDSVKLAEDCGVVETMVISGIAHGDDILTKEDMLSIDFVMNRKIPEQWVYNKIPYVSSCWAEAAVKHYLKKDFGRKAGAQAFKTLANLAGGAIQDGKLVITKSQDVLKTSLEHELRNFYCLSVPTTAFLVRSNGHISVTGNCHTEAMTWLFREFIKEHRDIWTDELKSELYSIAEKMVELEDKFIELAFGDNIFEGLTQDEVKHYIRYIADRRLIGLGMKGIFKVKVNPLPWVEEILGAPEHTSFFEGKATSYSRGALTGNWGNVWKSAKQIDQDK